MSVTFIMLEYRQWKEKYGIVLISGQQNKTTALSIPLRFPS